VILNLMVRTRAQDLRFQSYLSRGKVSDESDDQPPHLFRYASPTIRSPLYPKSSTMVRILPGIKLSIRWVHPTPLGRRRYGNRASMELVFRFTTGSCLGIYQPR
jgi:hypothetical protein